jgi:DNA-directed RNA polymerase specialized sigma24 family protein
VRAEVRALRRASPLPDDETIARRPDAVLHSPATQEHSLFLNQLFHAIHTLPPEEREAVILCHIMGYAEEADDPAKRTAATICGVTGRTIRNRLTRAAAKLSRFTEDL